MRILIVAFQLLLLTACSTYPTHYCVVGTDEFVIDSYRIRQGKEAILEMMGEDPGIFPCNAMEEYDDLIEEEDVINIGLYHPTRRDLREAFDSINKTMGGFRVKNGCLSLPSLSPIKVAGLSIKDAQRQVQFEIEEELEDGEIFLEYKDRARQKVTLIGLVRAAALPINGKTRLYDILSAAGVDRSANLFMSYVEREGQMLAVDLHRLMNEGDMCQNIVMRGGDKIFIAKAEDASVVVLGEVVMPTLVPLPYGYTTLPEALVHARGIPYTGDRRNIQIIRGNLECPKVYVISWNHLVSLPNQDLLLMPGDTVFVSEKPITQWNRFISQLLPSLTGARDLKTTYKFLFND